ncbi:MAG: glycosyltransferase [Pirellulales bacterium]|nr:glycosyltransferase [Pirellulales bacterium]
MCPQPILFVSAGSSGNPPEGGDGPARIAAAPRPNLLKTGSPRTRRRDLRIALYSHDTMGIGHMRRNLLVAQALMQSPSVASCLIVAGAREAAALAMPARVDCLTLPAFKKQRGGGYRSRCLHMHFRELALLRSKTIHAAIEAYAPDVFIVDKVPRGVGGELELTLESLRRRGRTHCVLGLREVLDSTIQVRNEWRDDAGDRAVEKFYDAVWVYGDPAVYDPVREYGFSPEVAGKVRYTGYFDQRRRLEWGGLRPEDPPAGLGLPPGRLVLCMVGGGQDGASLARAFTEAVLGFEMNAVVLTGPFMPPRVRERLRHLAADAPRVRVLEFVAEPSLLLATADRVVSMGGYNTVTEILSFGKRALIVPRTAPRQEQLIRAQRLCELGLVDMLHPHDLTPAAIAAWLASDPGPVPPVRDQIDFNGLTRLPEFLAGLLDDAGGAGSPIAGAE